MNPRVLLLDCSHELLTKLQKQGFNAEAGTIGFVTGARHLPSQVYEKDIFIYDPQFSVSGTTQINHLTPEFSLDHIEDRILRGGIMLTFINNFDNQKSSYQWIPMMPNITSTKDNVVATRSALIRKEFLPFITENEIETPVLRKLVYPNESYQLSQKGYHPQILFFNQNEEVLGYYTEYGNGYLFFLPRYKSNNDVVLTFLNRILPKLFNQTFSKSLVDTFISIDEGRAKQKIEAAQAAIASANAGLEKAREELVLAGRMKINTIQQDETANVLLKYYNTAIQQEDVALFYLYKIIEVLEDKYGGESAAKAALGQNSGWNLIGKIANVSYGDIRHAPKVGEKIKQWSPDEIKQAFEAAEKITMAYFETLFKQSA